MSMVRTENARIVSAMNGMEHCVQKSKKRNVKLV